MHQITEMFFRRREYMSFNPTDEQYAIINWQGQQLVVNAFSGTGKTSTLVQFARASPDSRMLYLAYNRAIRDEAERKFPFNVECRTSHQLAYARVGRHYRHRLVPGLRITDVARKLNTRYWALARVAGTGLNHFICSADAVPGLHHLPDKDEMRGVPPADALRAVQLLWNEMSNPGDVPGDARYLSETLPVVRCRPVSPMGHHPV